MSEEFELVVNGQRYSGWKSLRVARSVESIAGTFALEVTDKWSDAKPWPIREEDECRVELDGNVVIDGYIDKRDPQASASERQLSYSGRDRAAALVDCSLVLSNWTYRNQTLFEFASTIAKPWGVKVSLQPGLSLQKRSKIVIQPGDKAYDVLAREAAEDGVMLVSDGAGGIVITRGGTERATALIEGENVLSVSASYDGSERFYRYVVVTQSSATDEAYGNATRVLAEAFDEGVRRKDRVLLIQPDKGYSVADARRRAGWEARIRAARADSVTAQVQGWKQPNGRPWPINALCYVKASRTVQVDGDMRIAQVENTIGEQGRVTQLRLVRPDAFTPEPTVSNVKASGARWKKQFEKGAF